jgi:hypothetical protein
MTDRLVFGQGQQQLRFICHPHVAEPGIRFALREHTVRVNRLARVFPSIDLPHFYARYRFGISDFNPTRRSLKIWNATRIRPSLIKAETFNRTLKILYCIEMIIQYAYFIVNIIYIYMYILHSCVCIIIIVVHISVSFVRYWTGRFTKGLD